MKKHLIILLIASCFSFAAAAQPTHAVNDEELQYRETKELIAKEQYALAYPLVKSLLAKYPENRVSDHTYLREDILYFEILCRLKFMQDVAADDAVSYINGTNNEPRTQMLAFHLAHYYFLKEDYTKAIQYFLDAGYDNISNEQAADAKFELAYSYFNLNQFGNAKPLFAEIIQLPDNKYFIPSQYYYGFISYNEGKYDDALKAFKFVETVDPYQGIVPYYISEIYYFQERKEEALRYGQAVLDKGGDIYYKGQLNLLIGQLHYEKEDYAKALPLLDEYVKNSDKVSKEVMYEWSYANYKQGNVSKAIDGFRQLSNEKDSMGQNSMYLLGDLYLKTGDKANARNAFQYSAFNSSNPTQQKVSRFNYAKLSYELGYQDIALAEMRKYIQDYPSSEYDEEAREILLNILSRTNNFREAMNIYKGFQNPTPAMQRVYPNILYGRAIELINDQQLAAADALLSDVVSNTYATNVKPYAHFWKGEIALRQQRYNDAVRHITQFLRSAVPGQGEANVNAAKYNLAYSHLYLENFQNAYDNFQQVAPSVSLNSSALQQDAYLRSGDAAYMLRNYSRANAVYDAFISNSMPQADYATFQKALIAGISNSNEKIRLLNRIAIQYPTSSLLQDANMEIAKTYIADEKFREAIPYLDKILASSTNSLKPAAYLASGLAHYNSGNNKAALESYEDLIEKYPNSVEAREALESSRDIFVASGRPEDFVALSKKAGYDVSLSEADSLAFAAASLKYNNNDCAGAIPSLTRYIESNSGGAYLLDAHFLRSDCYLKAKDFDNALKGFAFIANKGFSKYFEPAALEAARLNYFEFKNYSEAKKYFEMLRSNARSQEIELEVLRGLTRTYYQLKSYSQAGDAARELLAGKGLTTDDKSIANLVLGKYLQENGNLNGAIQSFKSVAAINRSGWGAEARYEIAASYFGLKNLAQAEKAANAVIKETGSYDFWVTSSYILLGDIFMEQKDFFNAKATYESVAQNAVIAELKAKASDKLALAKAAEKQQSKISN